MVWLAPFSTDKLPEERIFSKFSDTLSFQLHQDRRFSGFCAAGCELANLSLSHVSWKSWKTVINPKPEQKTDSPCLPAAWTNISQNRH